MSEFPSIALGAIANITMGQSPGSETYSSEENGLPFLQGCAEFGALYPLPEIYCDPPLRIAKKDSILISVRAPVGTMNVADQDYCIGRGLGSVHGIAGKTNTSFLRYAIAQNVSFLHRRSQGSTFLAISSGELRLLPIPDIGLTTQGRIAEVLSILDRTIEKTEALIAKYQQIKAGLMHDLFTRGVTADGKLRPPREQAPELYQETSIGWIPKEWKVGKLSQYLDPLTGIKPGPFGSSLTKSNHVSGGFRVYGQEQVIAGSLEIGEYYITQAKFQEMAAFEVQAEDVLISLVGTVGCVLVAKPPFERGIINPRLMRLRPARKVGLSGFIKQLLLSANVRRQLDALAGGGTMPVINGKIVRRLVIPLLSFDEQSKIFERIDAIDGTIASTSNTFAQLQQQKSGLMSDLLTGRVRVNFS